MPRLPKRFGMMVAQPIVKILDLQFQNRTMAHIFRKTKACTQHAPFCVLSD